MAGDAQITVDGSQFALRMQQLKRYVGHDLAKQCLPYEAGQLVRQVVKVTPPFGSGSRRKIGRDAVKGQILRTMRPISYKDFTKNKDLRKRVKTLEDAGDLARLQQLFAALKSPVLGRNKGVAHFAARAHTSRRDRRGRISRNSWPLLMVTQADRTALAAYIKQMQGRVGWHIAGWRAAADATGEKLPPFAAGLPAPSSYVAIMDGEKPSVTIRNAANKSPALPEQVRFALKGREKALAAKVSRLIAGKAVNLGFATYQSK